MTFKDRLGEKLERAREKSGLWKKLFFGGLILLVVLNFFIHPHHPHVQQENYPGFWAVFALFAGVVMIWVIKKFIANVIGVSEDFYERND